MKEITDIDVARKFLQIKQNADDRGIEFNLSLTSVRNLLKAKRCRYTGVKLNRVKGDPCSKTFDRVDNTKGYVKGNVVACSLQFNQIKGQITKDAISKILKVMK